MRNAILLIAILALILCAVPAARMEQQRDSLLTLSIETTDGQLPGDLAVPAVLTIRQDGRVHTQPIEIKERGNTSRRFPKKSYRVKIVNEQGEKDKLSIGGLRNDDDWILNPMYGDTSKIREALAYELWQQMNSSGTMAASSRMVYAELYLNGEYWGLYGVQERIDRKQVDGNKRAGVLYKIIANDRPSVDELLSCRSEEVCRGFELAFSGAGVRDPWIPAAAYMAFLNGEGTDIPARLSVQNTIDYGLWAMLTQAHDCHFKNQFLNCVFDGSNYTMYKIPWDLNNTFGDVWINDGADSNHTGYKIGQLVVDGAFGVLLDSGDAQIYRAIQDRWSALRAGEITEEKLIARAYALYAPLADALERDSLRWPECGMGNGNAVNIRDIDDYIRNILPRMDDYIAGLGVEENTEEEYG